MKKKTFNLILFTLLAFTSFNLSSCNSQSVATEVSTLDTTDLIKSNDIDSEYDSADLTSLSSNTISSEGTYLLEGELTTPIIIDASDDDKVTIVLNNVTMNCASFACIYVKNADKVYLNVQGDNTLTSTGSFTQIDDNKVDGCIFSKSDLTIKGSGSLTVNSSLHGVVGKDDLVITVNNIKVNAKKHGIQANDSLASQNTTFDITANSDGIHIENEEDTSKGYIYLKDSNATIIASKDGISSSSIIQIENGDYNITATSSSSIEDESMKGIKATGNMILAMDNLTVNSKDDALHSNASLEIDKGTYTITSGDDGIHADESLVINDGDITISKSYEGLEGKNITVNGGSILATSSDDGMNAAGGNDSSSFNRPGTNTFSSSNSDVFITINGGDITLNTSGDGIDANGSLYLTGGNVLVYGPTDNGNGALDYDSLASVTGGTLCAIGYSGMAQNFSKATQGSILYNTSTTYQANSKISLSDGSDTIYEVTALKSFNSVVITSPDITSSGSYNLTLGSNTYSISMTSYTYTSNGSTTTGGNQPGGGGGNQPGGGGRP